MRYARPCINIDGKAEYPWFEVSALHLVGSTRYNLLRAAQTEGNRHEKLLSIIDAFEPSLKEKWPLYEQRHDQVILQHDNGWLYVAPVKTYLDTLWEILPYPLYSPDIPPCDYHWFRLMIHGLAKQHIHSYEDAKK